MFVEMEENKRWVMVGILSYFLLTPFNDCNLLLLLLLKVNTQGLVSLNILSTVTSQCWLHPLAGVRPTNKRYGYQYNSPYLTN